MTALHTRATLEPEGHSASKPDGTLVNKTIAALEQRISNLEAKIKSIEK